MQSGFIGVARMGVALTCNLIRAKMSVSVFNILRWIVTANQRCENKRR